MEKLNLPQFEFKIIKNGNNFEIFDIFRKKFVILTPEEWVRQNFCKYLVQYKKFPISLIAIEKQIIYNNTKRRFDAVVFNRKMQPLIVIEFKAKSVKIDENVFHQISIYNNIFKAPYLIVSNGLEHYYFNINFKQNSINQIEDIENFDNL